MTGRGNSQLAGAPVTDAISAAMVDLYSEFYGHPRTAATTYINDNVVVCALSDLESIQVPVGEHSEVIDGRVAFQGGAQDEFTAGVEQLMWRRVTAFLSANQTSPGIACKLFVLEAPPEGEVWAR